MCAAELPESFEVGVGPFRREVVYRSIWVNLSRKCLPRLPRELLDCSKLEVLTATDNHITRIEHVPAGVVRLFLTSNRLERLDPMPSGIWELRVERNRLTRLENLPPSLEILHAELNKIEHLDEESLPPYLRELHLDGNPVCRNPAARAIIEEVNSGRRAERHRRARIVLDMLSCCPSTK